MKILLFHHVAAFPVRKKSVFPSRNHNPYFAVAYFRSFKKRPVTDIILYYIILYYIILYYIPFCFVFVKNFLKQASTDYLYMNFVGYNFEVSHCRHVCNC